MSRLRRAFSLMELVIVMMVLAILTTIAVPSFQRASRSAKINATITDIEQFEKAAWMVRGATGVWPRDSTPSVFPKDFRGYLDTKAFAKTPPIGGEYDWNSEAKYGNVQAGISVYFDNQRDVPLADFLEIDRRLDDGNLATGRVFLYQKKVLQVMLEVK